MARNGHAASGVDAIRKDLNSLRADFAALSKDVGKFRHDGAVGLQNEIEERLDDMRDRLSNTADILVEEAEEQIGAARDIFKEHPLTVVGGAFGLGLLVAKLLR